MAFAWVVIDNGHHLGKARSGSFYLPPGITDLVHQGRELGEADDVVTRLSKTPANPIY